MITTMGERYTRLPHLLPFALAAMLLASECRADWRVVPGLALTERYTDNFYQENDDLKRSQFISELTPSLTFAKTGPRFILNGTTQWSHFHFRDSALRDTRDHNFEYALTGRGTLAEDFLYVDASASAKPQTISSFGPRAEDAPYLATNLAKIETWRISPHLERHFGQAATLSVRYARDSVKGGNTRGFADSLSDSVIVNLASGPAYSKLGWSLLHRRQDLKDSISGETASESTAVNLRYTLTPRIGLTASGGYDRYEFTGPGADNAGRNWSLGFDWTPSLRTRMSASLGRHFYGHTGSFSLLHRSRSTVWNAAYNDGVTTARDQFLLPSTLDTAALLDRLFSSSITDPVARQEAVAAYIQASGLPPSLSESINFLSNRYYRQKELQASMAFKLVRTSAVLSLFSSERIALSSQQSDSALLGSQLSSRNDNVRQHGANARVNYRLGPRSSAVASANWSRSRSLTTELVDTRRDFQIGLTRELGRQLRAAVDLNRRFGTISRLGRNTGPYHEHVISASVSAQF